MLKIVCLILIYNYTVYSIFLISSCCCSCCYNHHHHVHHHPHYHLYIYVYLPMFTVWPCQLRSRQRFLLDGACLIGQGPWLCTGQGDRRHLCPTHVRYYRYTKGKDTVAINAFFCSRHCLQFESAKFIPGRDFSWTELTSSSQGHDCVPVKATDALYVLHTSGATGTPKVGCFGSIMFIVSRARGAVV